MGSSAPSEVHHPSSQTVFARVAEGDVTGVVVTAGGERYVCGYETFVDRGFDVSIRRLGSSGWTRNWDGPAHDADKASEIAVSSAGSVYVVGSSRTKAGGSSTVLLTCSAKGTRLWVRRWTGPDDANPQPKRLAIDGQGESVQGPLPRRRQQHLLVCLQNKMAEVW